MYTYTHRASICLDNYKEYTSMIGFSSHDWCHGFVQVAEVVESLRQGDEGMVTHRSPWGFVRVNSPKAGEYPLVN